MPTSVRQIRAAIERSHRTRPTPAHFSDPLAVQSGKAAKSFPATRLKGWIKQAATDLLSPDEIALFDACFPQFRWQSDMGKVFDYLVTSKGAFPYEGSRPRRYAGGPDLLRSSYYTLCTDPQGDDNSTLAWELMAYWDSDSALFPGLVDTAAHREELSNGHFDFACLAGGQFLILYFSPLKRGLFGRWRSPRVKHGTLVIPLRVRGADCSNVFDLRLPKTQDWLAQQYRSISPSLSRAIEDKRPGFPEGPMSAVLEAGFQFLIPTLLDPHLGGSLFHLNLGKWLRANGCNGMVYPSARRNFRVDSTDDRVYEFAGWNFVLYANSIVADVGSAEPLEPPFPSWLDGPALGIQVCSGYDQGRRLWEVLGCEESERNYYNYQHDKFLGKAPPPGPFFDPRLETRWRPAKS